MESVAALFSEHAEITRHAHQVRGAARRGMDGAADAHQAIASLSRLLRAHLVAEDRMVYRRLLTCRDRGVAETARAARQGFATLARDWRRYAGRWTAEAIAQDAAAFAAESEALLQRIEARIVFEDETLYPLALGLADLPLRANPG
jgi:hemerythrin-like domain-containing protein